MAGLNDLFITDRFKIELVALSFLASTSSMGLGILESQGISGEGGAILGVVDEGLHMIPSATLCISFSHLSHRFKETAGFSRSGVEIGLPGGRWRGFLTRGNIIADVDTDFVCKESPTLTSFVFDFG